MVGGESFNGGGETPREISEKRGEKVLDAREAAILNKLDELQKEKERLLAEIEALKSGETIPKAEVEVEADEPENIEEEPAEESEPATDEVDTAGIVVGEAPIQNNAEIERQEKTERIKNKAKKSGAFKKKVTTVLISALAALTLLTSASLLLNNRATVPEEPVSETTVVYEEAEKIGIQDGYDEKGMWLSENKGGMYRFACGQEVLEETDGDVTEAVKYTAKNQSESFADYLAGLPSDVQPNDFKGLSILEAESKLEGMSDEDYEVVKDNFNFIMDNALTRDVTLNGQYDNAFMRLKDTGDAINHQNMELVHCVTNEKGTKATEFYWLDKDGKEIGSMIVKITMNEDGGVGCIQVVKEKGTSQVYKGLEDVEDVDEPGTPGEEQKTPEDEPGTPGDEPGTPGDDTPDKPEPDKPEPDEPTPPPAPEIAPKDEDNLIRIDEQIEEDIEENINTDELVITPTVEVKQEDLTEKPAAEVYDGTAPTFVQNEVSKEAEPVQETISEANDYSEDLGPANYEPEELPVQPNVEAQEQADQEQAEQKPATLEEAVNNFGFN